MSLPDARKDGYCADCLGKAAVTTDGRFCKKCLKQRICHDTPMTGCFKGVRRSAEQKQAAEYGNNDPSIDNAVRSLEGD